MFTSLSAKEQRALFDSLGRSMERYLHLAMFIRKSRDMTPEYDSVQRAVQECLRLREELLAHYESV